jgi:hypothetical protein
MFHPRKIMKTKGTKTSMRTRRNMKKGNTGRLSWGDLAQSFVPNRLQNKRSIPVLSSSSPLLTSFSFTEAKLLLHFGPCYAKVLL